MKNCKIIYPQLFIPENIVFICINNIFYCYKISKTIDYKYYLKLINYYPDDIIFSELNINKDDFMLKLFGYKSNSIWPECNSLGSLKKQLKYLEHYDKY